MRIRCGAGLLLLLLLAPPLAAQGATSELDELRTGVANMRSHLPQFTSIAERSARFLGFETTGRFLIPQRFDPSFYLEFLFRAGGPPDTRDTSDSTVAGLLLLPIRHWTGVGLGVASTIERSRALQRPVVLIAPATGLPPVVTGGWLIDDGAANADRVHAPINGVINVVAGWAFYAEVVSAATRAGWQPGILVSVLAPDTSLHNADARFRMPGRTPPAPIAAGTLASAYLDAVDSALTFAATAEHQQLVASAAARVRDARAAGHRVFVGSCGHYLSEEIAGDTLGTPFIPVNYRKGMSAELVRHGAAVHDVVVWFGYGGYDCPNAEVSATFRTLGLDVVLVTNNLPATSPAGVVATIPLSWQLPDAVVSVTFPPWHLAPISSVEMGLHYLWLRRLAAITRQ